MSSIEMSSMDTIMEDEDSFLSSTNAIIYRTSDHSGWAGESMISDPNIASSSTSTDHHHHQQQISTAAGSGDDDDLMMVISGASSNSFMNNKQSGQQEIRIFNVDFRALSESSNRMKSCACLDLNIGGALNNETVKTLMACAEAIEPNNLNLDDAFFRNLPMREVAAYYAEAMNQRTQKGANAQNNKSYYYKDEFSQMSLYRTFSYLTANQTILEAFANSNRVNVIDFSFNQGLQWPPLMQALATRPGGPPALRLTGIAPPRSHNIANTFQENGWQLAQLAESIGVEFEFHGIVVKSLADVEAVILNIISSRNVEVAAVNFDFELQDVFSRPGEIDKFLKTVKELQLKIVTIIEKEANHNACVFMDWLNQEWHYFSTLLHLLGNSKPKDQDSEMVEHYLEIERVERHQTMSQWRVRMKSAGYIPVQNKQASMLMDLFQSRDGLRVEENDGCLRLTLNSRPLIATSAWQLPPPSLG